MTTTLVDGTSVLGTTFRPFLAPGTGLPRTEVDFAEDLHRAQSEVYPAIARLEGT